MTEQKSNAGKKVKSKLSTKRKRQYEHIKESEKNEGKDIKTAKRIAMANSIKHGAIKGKQRNPDNL